MTINLYHRYLSRYFQFLVKPNVLNFFFFLTLSRVRNFWNGVYENVLYFFYYFEKNYSIKVNSLNWT